MHLQVVWQKTTREYVLISIKMGKLLIKLLITENRAFLAVFSWNCELLYSAHLIHSWVCGIINYYTLFSKSVIFFWQHIFNKTLKPLNKKYKQFISNLFCFKSLRNWLLRFTFIYTALTYLTKEYIYFDINLGTCSNKSFLFLYSDLIKYLSWTKEGSSSARTAFNILDKECITTT